MAPEAKFIFETSGPLNAVLWIRGRPVAKFDPLLGWAIHQDHRWATQLSISGNMIKQKSYKFCVHNWKTNVF